jgi:hypothetical protein
VRTDDEVEHEHEAQEVVQHEVDHHQLIVRPESARNRTTLMKKKKILTTKFPLHELYVCTYAHLIPTLHIYTHTQKHTRRHRHRHRHTHIHMQSHAIALGPILENMYR